MVGVGEAVVEIGVEEYGAEDVEIGTVQMGVVAGWIFAFS